MHRIIRYRLFRLAESFLSFSLQFLSASVFSPAAKQDVSFGSAVNLMMARDTRAEEREDKENGKIRLAPFPRGFPDRLNA